ncbi:amidohydrolase family protein [Auraticoccus sp. F435]|uniref:Amidohydrolase family protein n=1 Tax=Auraticoccus cholistanensis TaxID=2656650 RepID=A0A6A9UU63_9ACTN|nr:amidohydrolase family protein [Auraticoccus cholistanensis]MVA75192.1 amidohydrolase family protein [Auraticoccus cholistanensis]
MTDIRTIDAHQHFWVAGESEQPWRGPGHDALVRDFTAEDLTVMTRELGIDGTVLIESEDGPEENDRLARWSRQAPVVGVVGWLPLADPEAARAEWRRLDLPRMVGTRCLVGRQPLDWLQRPDVVGLFEDLAAAGLAWDVVPLERAQCEQVVALAERVPGLRIVVDHLARPPLDGAPEQPWLENLQLLAAAPGIAIKFSVGLDVVSRWSWDADQLLGCARAALDAFGPDRVMMASNWPVSELGTDYRTLWRDQTAVLEQLLPDADQRRMVLGGTATRWYDLEREER